jgi:hypothetical protein
MTAPTTSRQYNDPQLSPAAVKALAKPTTPERRAAGRALVMLLAAKQQEEFTRSSTVLDITTTTDPELVAARTAYARALGVGEVWVAR